MTKRIQTLVRDIYETVKRKDGWFSEDIAAELGREVAKPLYKQFNTERRGTLRLSGLGPKCPRHLWYSIHHPELAEQMPPWAEIKFSYGHFLEAFAITLAKAAGHDVRGEQDELVVDGIVGHRDCVIDGCIVDVKSASSRAFTKFETGAIGQEDGDPFGYLDQLDGYLVGSADDPVVTTKDRGYLLAIDKTLGHVCLYEHTIREEHLRRRIESYKRIVSADRPPKCECGVRPDGKSGNMQLDIRASYSAFKHCCFPGLRTFLYADGPRFLTTVVRKPDVVEVDKLGHVVYN